MKSKTTIWVNRGQDVKERQLLKEINDSLFKAISQLSELVSNQSSLTDVDLVRILENTISDAHESSMELSNLVLPEWKEKE